MKLIKITKKGTLYFEMSDGRITASYNSGYIRMIPKNRRIYQLNKVSKIYTGYRFYSIDDYFYKRILIKCPKARYERLLAFDTKNCIKWCINTQKLAN